MIDALLLIQDVQFLCYTVIFGLVFLQQPADKTRRWLWYSFLANTVGAVLDFAGPHLPAWLGRGVDLTMIPLSYALLNVAFVYFLRRFRFTIWISVAILAGTTPLFLLWSGRAVHFPADALGDLAIGLQCLATAPILCLSSERATKMPRLSMAVFFFPFAGIEIARAVIALGMHRNPDTYSHTLMITSAVSYVVSGSLLPLAFLWLINSRLEAELRLQNQLDPLTQVLNRRGLRQTLERETELAVESGKPLSVGIFDLDYFKKLNDRYGHRAGDSVLIAVANLLRYVLPENASVARIGGEEFVVLLPETDAKAAFTVLEAIRIKIEDHAERTESGDIYTTASFGVTTMEPSRERDGTELLHEADVALYRAKGNGRNNVQVFSPGKDDTASARDRGVWLEQ